MKLFLTWMRRHPIKFTLLILYALACAAALRWDVAGGLVFMAVGYGVWSIVYLIDTNKLLGLLVAASLLSTNFVQSRETLTEGLAGHGLSVATGLGFYRVTTREAR